MKFCNISFESYKLVRGSSRSCDFCVFSSAGDVSGAKVPTLVGKRLIPKEVAIAYLSAGGPKAAWSTSNPPLDHKKYFSIHLACFEVTLLGEQQLDLCSIKNRSLADYIVKRF